MSDYRQAAARASSPAASSSAWRWPARSCSNPTVLLLDEPLGALDAKLRKHLQLELKALQQSVGVTFVYVTHDQEEALTMSDRLAVMRDGRVEQVGAPEAVYAAPETAYVAGFLGSANVLDVEVLGPDAGAVACRLGEPRAARGRRRRARGPGRSSSGRSGSSLAAADTADRPRRVTTRSTASSTGSSTSARPPMSCCGWPTARPCWSRCPTRASRCPRRSWSGVRCARPSRRRRRGCSAGEAEAALDPTRGAARPAGVSAVRAPTLTGGGAGSPARRARRPRTSSRWRRPARGRRPGPRARPGSTGRRAARTKVIAKASASTAADLAGGLPVADDPRDRVAPALVQLDPVLGDLGVPERLRPQVEPQPPRARDLVVALRDAGESRRASRAARRGGASARSSSPRHAA